MHSKTAPPLLERRFPARAEELSGMREALRGALDRAGCPAELAADLVLAVDEACQNVIRHAYGGECAEPIELHLERHGEELVLLLADQAEAVDRGCLDQGRDLEDVRPGGLGTHFIRRVMDHAEFVDPPSGRGNLLKLVKKL